MARLTEKGERRCAFPGCSSEVTEEDERFGCGYFVCETHTVTHVMGVHEVVEHWDENED